jgi:pre-rRNA-processing protein TSR3
MNNNFSDKFSINILMYRQDDPNKCTASRIIKFHLANEVKRLPRSSIVLNPYADRYLKPSDTKMFKGICALDCSWNLASKVIQESRGFSNNRKLPALLAGNPINYAKLGTLSTVEALAGALYILGFEARAMELIEKFRWGHTFIELNSEILKDYSKVKVDEDIDVIEKEYFPHIFGTPG